MSAYWAFFAIEFAFVLGARGLGFKNRLVILIPAIIFASLFSGLRGNIGTDTYSYRFFYNNFHNPAQLALEPIFSGITLLGEFFNLPDQFFLAAISALQAGFLILLIRCLSSKDLFFLFYLSTYYITFQFNLIRFGVALLVTGFALVLIQKRRSIASGALYFLGLATHFSMILCVPFLKWRKRSVILGLIFIIFIVTLVFPLLQAKFDDFFIQGCATGGWAPTFGIGFLFEISVCCVVLLKQRRIMDARLASTLFGYIVFRLAGCAIPGADRISMLFGFLFYLFLFADGFSSVAKILIIGLMCYNFYGTVMFLQNSDEAIQALVSGNSDFSIYEKTRWLPYQFFWEDDTVDNLSIGED